LIFFIFFVSCFFFLSTNNEERDMRTAAARFTQKNSRQLAAILHPL